MLVAAIVLAKHGEEPPSLRIATLPVNHCDESTTTGSISTTEHAILYQTYISIII